VQEKHKKEVQAQRKEYPMKHPQTSLLLKTKLLVHTPNPQARSKERFSEILKQDPLASFKLIPKLRLQTKAQIKVKRSLS
jgi:hypothetical protein